MTASDRLRLFIAAPVPNVWHPWLSKAQRNLEQALPGYFRMTRPETWHLTFLFLGSQSANDVPMINRALASVAHEMPRFDLRVGELGAPGQLDRPRLVWLRCDEGGILEGAQRQLVAALSDLRFDSAPLRAHVTLGRARKPSRVGFREVLTKLNSLERPDPVVIDQMVLYRSHLERTGARYEALLECKLT